MQEMSCIKELYLSANTLQSKFNLRDRAFIPTKEHSLSRHVQQDFAGGQTKCKRKKKNTSLHFMTAKGISKTFLHSYNVLFRYVIS